MLAAPLPKEAGVDLTKRQQEIFDFIKRYSARHGYPPTVRDIGKAVGLASSSTVHQHLANLERIGLLKRDPSKPRAIEMLDRAVAEVRRVVRPQDTAADGDIVVALVGEDATVKRYFRESDHVRLQPENDEMEPIRSREVRVLGKVVGLMRSI